MVTIVDRLKELDIPIGSKQFAAYAGLLAKFEGKFGGQDSPAWQTILANLVLNEGQLVPTLAIAGIDFSNAIQVQSSTPRLFLTVPVGARVADLEPIGDHAAPKLGYQGAPLPPGAVLIFPNQEGEKADVSDRPVVQWSGVIPGDKVIINNIAGHEAAIEQVVRSVFGVDESAAPNIWAYYNKHATIDNLRTILDILRTEHQLSNQYSTNKEVAELKFKEVGKSDNQSGVFVRDGSLCQAVHIPGKVYVIGTDSAQEILTDGWAVSVDGKDLRPLSAHAMLTTYTGHDVGSPPLWQCIKGSPLQGFERAFDALAAKMQTIKVETRVVNKGDVLPKEPMTAGKAGP